MTSSDTISDASSSPSSSTASTAATVTKTSNYSTKERNCQTVRTPPIHRLAIDDIYHNSTDPDDKPDLDILKEHLLLEGRLTERAALRIIETGIVKPSFGLFLIVKDSSMYSCRGINKS